MPAFAFGKKKYQNTAELAEEILGGKWKMPILWRLKDRSWRHNELKRDIGKVTHKMLTEQLRELERHGMITRKVFPLIPPRVEYSISKLGLSAIPVIESMRSWGQIFYRHRSRK